MKEYAQKAYDLMKEIERDENGNPLTFEGTLRSMKGEVMKKLIKGDKPIVNLWSLFEKEENEGDEIRGAVARRLTKEHADQFIAWQKFWDDHHPKPGAVPSKVGVEAQDAERQLWYWLPKQEVWAEIVTRTNHGSVPLSRFVVPNGSFIYIAGDSIVYPIATEAELEEKELSQIPNETTLQAIQDLEKGIDLHEASSVKEMMKELEEKEEKPRLDDEEGIERRVNKLAAVSTTNDAHIKNLEYAMNKRLKAIGDQVDENEARLKSLEEKPRLDDDGNEIPHGKKPMQERLFEKDDKLKKDILCPKCLSSNVSCIGGFSSPGFIDDKAFKCKTCPHQWKVSQTELNKIKEHPPNSGCLSCGKGVLGGPSDNLKHPYAICCYCKAKLAKVSENSDDECTVGDMEKKSKYRLRKDDRFLLDDSSEIWEVLGQNVLEIEYGIECINRLGNRRIVSVNTPCTRLPKKVNDG